ncbi:hypothetical protein C3744_29460 [Priestia megaterium]|uniref:DUF3791 domain-containing protein n=1 Tax=Priestia megaterium TaxID=1404 RepID=A0A3D8WTA7_PRIMG|nr:hypothetical protein [Priestia megaterium]RDZ05532.1 hypothetical protein C3744_29460 [Priestia megaterium]
MKRLEMLGAKDKFYVEEFIRLVKTNLMKESRLPEIEAVKIMKDSLFWDMIEDDPEFVLHYGTAYWVEEIISEQEGVFQHI